MWRVSLRESAPLAPSARRVDREKGVIFGVRVLGTASDNDRRYLPEAIAAAKHLYEGAKVKANHPRKPHEERPVEDTFGWLENVRQDGDGALYADLHILNPKTDLAESVFQAAERNPKLFGLSHNADGRGYTDRDGTFVVQEITDLRSVDLVDSPATNKSLFEGKTIATTLKQIIESSKTGAKRKRRLLEYADGAMYEDEPMADAPVEAPPPDAGADAGDPKALLAQAVAALVQSEDAGDHDLATKILKLLKPEEAMPEADEPDGDEGDDGEEAVEESDDDEDGKGEEKTTEEARDTNGGGWDNETERYAAMGAMRKRGDLKSESRRAKKPAKGTATLTEARAKVLCKFGGIEASKEILESVVGLREDRALAILGLLKAGGQKGKGGVRSSAPGQPLTESARPPKNAEEFVRSILIED